jgi:hypothetical protein
VCRHDWERGIRLSLEQDVVSCGRAQGGEKDKGSALAETTN